MNMKKLRFGVTDVLLTALSAALYIGSRSWFAVCGKTTESGAFMTCHWAGEALTAVALLALALSVLRALLPDSRIKAGMGIALAGVAVLALRVPGGVIPLCQGEAMACRARTQPWSLALSAALLLACLADAAIQLSRAAGAKHTRPDAKR